MRLGTISALASELRLFCWPPFAVLAFSRIIYKVSKQDYIISMQRSSWTANDDIGLGVRELSQITFALRGG